MRSYLSINYNKNYFNGRWIKSKGLERINRKLEFPTTYNNNNNNKDIGIDDFTQKVCKLFDKKINIDQDLDRSMSQEFPFIITLEN
jgi:hypothetical protein